MRERVADAMAAAYGGNFYVAEAFRELLGEDPRRRAA
jgi:hypothetical protein